MTIRLGGGSLVLSGYLLAAACTAESTVGQGAADWEARRTRMIDSQLRARGISNPRVLEAMRKVPGICSFPRRIWSPRLRRRPAADWPRPDDLAALHRRLHERSARAQADAPRGDRNRDAIRLPGGHSGRAGGRGVHNGDRAGAGGAGPRRAGRRGIPERPRATRERLSRLAGRLAL